jgi:hypothetical protein
MSPSTKIAYSRLLYADFISDENEEIEIIKKINGFGFAALAHEGNTPTKFSVGNIDDFIGRIRPVCKSDSELLDYISNVVFWVYRDGILPLKVAIIEVVLKTDDLQKLKKSDLESKIWKLSLLLGSCFSEGSIPLTDSSKDFRILKFSSRAIPNVALRNFVAEFVIEAERKFFDDFNKELDSLEKEISTRDMVEQKIIETRDDGKIPASEVRRVLSKATAQQEQKIRDIRSNVISLEPVSFLEGGFSYDQSIVRGYANEMFIIGKIVQGSLDNSTPLYLTFLSMGVSEIPLANLESMPVLQFPGTPGLLNFSFGAGQILALQLLNTWNRHVEGLIREITTKQNLAQMKTKTDANETLEELQDLIFHTGIDEKISINYLRELQDLASPSKKTFLYELPMPPEETTPYSSNPEQYGLEKPGPLISNLASHILKSLDLNEKHLLGIINLRRSKMDVLKIEEDRKFSRRMLSLTVVIAVATIVNVVLFLARII